MNLVGFVLLLAGGAYSARALNLIRAPGELPLNNSYPLVIGSLLCVSATGIFICGAGRNEQTGQKFNVNYVRLFVSLICFIIFTLTFEKMGTVKSSFLFSFILGALWNRNVFGSEVQRIGFKRSAENILASCVCAGIWLLFEKVFNLSLP